METSPDSGSLSRTLDLLIAQLPPVLEAEGFDAIASTCRRQLEEIRGTLEIVEMLRAGAHVA